MWVFYYYYFIKMLLFRQKLAKFAANRQNMSFPGWYFSICYFIMTIILFVEILILLFRRKSAKFMSNCQNMNFSVTYVLKCPIFFRKYVIFSWKFRKMFWLVLWCYTYLFNMKRPLNQKIQRFRIRNSKFKEFRNKKF